MLTSRRLAGIRTYNGRETAKAVWQPIIDEATSLRVRALLETRTPMRGAPRCYLLTGLLVCGRCGAKLRAQNRPGGHRYACTSYDANGCGRTYIQGKPLEALVSDAVVGHLIARTDYGSQGIGNTAEVEAAAQAEREHLDELSDMYAAKEITRAEWQRARAPIVERLEAIERTLNPIDPEVQALRDLAPFGLLTVARQQDICALVIKAITVAPASLKGRKAFEPKRVRIDWR